MLILNLSSCCAAYRFIGLEYEMAVETIEDIQDKEMLNNSFNK